MGQAISSIFAGILDRLFGTKEMRVVMLGLDAAGKTTILYKLHIGEILTTVRGKGSAFMDVKTCSAPRRCVWSCRG